MANSVCVLIDYPRRDARAQGQLLYGWEWAVLDAKIKKAGLLPDQVQVRAISNRGLPTPDDYARCLRELNAQDIAVIVPLGEKAMHFTTGKHNIRKWHLSPLDTMPEFRCNKAVPTFHPDQTRAEYHLNLYIELALQRAAQNNYPGPWKRKEKRFHLNPCFEEIVAILESIVNEEWLSLDLETGNSQINTFGVAWSPNDALAIKVLPDQWPQTEHYKLWQLIDKLCRGPSKKIAQNGIYERSYLSRYGVHVNNFAHDTMCAMRFLWPELDKGLDNVGRIHTMEPYWKDTGKEVKGEGGRKDWGNIQDWDQHLLYNALDTSGSMEAAFSQRQSLQARGLLGLYDNYVTRLFDPTYEMSVRGLPLNDEKRQELVTEYESKSNALVSKLSKEINPRSSKQKLELLIDKGIKLPKKRDPKTGKQRPSADELSLKKARLKYPDDTDIQNLLKISTLEKALSSYLRVGTLDDGLIRFMLDPFATETGRMACKKDPWDGGFNAQTMGSKIKKMIEWPEHANRVFVEIDLAQAESRFVAYDACEETLIRMLENDEDVHSYVAAEIYTKPMCEITKAERQLGKKSGHGANYSMGVTTFQDSCLKEMDFVLKRKEATKVLEAYHKLFPGIRKWHAKIREQVSKRRMLENPLGLQRQFFGRIDDNTFREAYAYRPQSTIPMITNYLLFGLDEQRKQGKLDFWFHNQVHDSVWLSCKPDQVGPIAEFAANADAWHPEVVLPAGRLVIPIETEWGRNLGEMKEFEL